MFNLKSLFLCGLVFTCFYLISPWNYFNINNILFSKYLCWLWWACLLFHCGRSIDQKVKETWSSSLWTNRKYKLRARLSKNNCVMEVKSLEKAQNAVTEKEFDLIQLLNAPQASLVKTLASCFHELILKMSEIKKTGHSVSGLCHLRSLKQPQ